MKKWILTGDLKRATRVVAQGETLEEAVANAEAGSFTIFEVHDSGEFTFDGDDDHAEELHE